MRDVAKFNRSLKGRNIFVMESTAPHGPIHRVAAIARLDRTFELKSREITWTTKYLGGISVREGRTVPDNIFIHSIWSHVHPSSNPLRYAAISITRQGNIIIVLRVHQIGQA